ncbi:hypothetical protein N9A14_03345 [Gammaproteobacteria bacterium]|nr:hypothetical protein [Gammaproteobacteria bacterium]
MKNDFNKKIQGFIKDLEDASPNIKNTLTEIYPVTIKLNIEGHKDIYISLAKDVKAISFSPIEKIDFEMVSSLTEIFELLITKKIKRDMFIGDQELAMVLANTLKKSDTDFLYLIDRYFGNISAVFIHLVSQAISNKKFIEDSDEKMIHSKLRNLTIRMDRLEAINNL